MYVFIQNHICKHKHHGHANSAQNETTRRFDNMHGYSTRQVFRKEGGLRGLRNTAKRQHNSMAIDNAKKPLHGVSFLRRHLSHNEVLPYTCTLCMSVAATVLPAKGTTSKNTQCVTFDSLVACVAARLLLLLALHCILAPSAKT